MPSTPLPPAPSRRLSSRRGSTTAPDPFAKHGEINSDPARSSSSILTIVRVISPPTTPTHQTQTPPLDIAQGGSRKFHRKIGSNPDVQQSNAGTGVSPGRMSFAFNTFGSPQNASGNSDSSSSHGGNTSPLSSPRLRPSSPTLGPHRTSSSHSPKPRLSPDQLFNLARSSTNPKLFPSPSTDHSSSPHGHSPLAHHSANSSPTLSASVGATTSPATFTPLPDDIWLPFIDRPSEVASLISTPPSVKLFALLAQTFSHSKTGDKPLVVVNDPNFSPPLSAISTPSPSSLSSSISSLVDAPLPSDPAEWSYVHLHMWLTCTTRTEVPDPLWVAKARKCILTRSELIWERVKGALGVPPELDIDLDVDNLVFDDEEIDTDDMEDEGRKAHGHWEDWDAVMNSPILEKSRSMRSRVADSPPISIMAATGKQSAYEEDQFKSSVDDKLQAALDGTLTPSVAVSGEDGEHTVSPTPHPQPPPMTSQLSIPTSSSTSSFGLSIEPLLSTSSSTGLSSLHPPPLSLPSSLSPVIDAGLGDIAEGPEEEEESPTNPDAGPTQGGEHKTPTEPAEEGDLIDPTHIHGLKFSTSPLPSGQYSPTTTMMSDDHTAMAVSPIDIPTSLPTSGYSSSRSASFSSLGEAPPYRRASFGASLGRTSSLKSMEDSESRYYGIGGGYESEGDGYGYDPVGDRAPGNPLFPSNFARLAVGPTLVANNPALRSPSLPPLPRYNLINNAHQGLHRSSSTNSSISNYSIHKTRSDSNSHVNNPALPAGGSLGVGFMSGRGNRFKRSSGHEYALTTASGSSIAGSE